MSGLEKKRIKTKEDLKQYLTCDKEVNGIKGLKEEFRYTWKYIKCLRKYEYYLNSGRGGYYALSLKCGCGG